MKILSIDIGTTNIKAIYKDGSIQHKFSIPVTTLSYENKREQDPQAIRNSLQLLINSCERDFGLQHIIISTAMHSLVFFDESMNPISNIMLWSDNRSDQLVSSLLNSEFDNYQITGTPFHSMSPYSKLLYEKNLSDEARFIGDLKSYLMYELTGNFVTDISSASASGLMDIYTSSWSLQTLKACDIDIDKLPEIKPIETQLDMDGMKVHIGSTDGVMANRGVHSLMNQLVLSVGTSVGVRFISDSKYLHPYGKSFCYSAGFNQYLIGNASNNGGNHLEWMVENIDTTYTYESLVKSILKGLPETIIAPYFYGERGPWWHPNISIDQRIYDVSKDDALLQVVYGLFTNIQLLINSLPDYNKHLPIILTGGFFKNEVVAQALCNYINHPLLIVEDEQAVCNYGLELIESVKAKMSGKMLVPTYSETLAILKSKALDYLNNYNHI